jgi:hypothetical protein
VNGLVLLTYVTLTDVSGDGAVRSFNLEYDQLIVAVGCDNTTFGTPGVEKNCHFLKELNGTAAHSLFAVAIVVPLTPPNRCCSSTRRTQDQATDHTEL